MNSHDQLPYPEIHIDQPNNLYAKIILGNIGGEDSEMSAVSLYFYNSLIAQEFPHVANAFHRLSITEMHHLRIFGKMALQLGADPRLWQPKGKKHVYWSPKHNRYTPKIKQLLSNALYGEYMTVEKYTKQAKTISDQGIVAVLNRIIADEQEHVKLVKEMLLTI